MAGISQSPVENNNSTLKLKGTHPISKAQTSNALAPPDALYSNIKTFTDFVTNENAKNQAGNLITALVADSIGLVGGSAPFELKQFSFSVINFNQTDVTARPRIRFYEADGPNGSPGTLIGGLSFAPITFTANSYQIFFNNPAPGAYVFNNRSFWAGMTFDDNGGTTGATLAQMNNLGQGVFNPIDIGNSTNGAFITDTAGGFYFSNPVGKVYNVPERSFNFGWEFISSTSLPVILKDLQVTNQGSANLLKWTTSQESNSSHFIIERSADGKNFSEIGKLNAAGNSSLPLQYNYSDDNPLSGMNFYRLEMVDKDNARKMSDIVSIRNLSASGMSIYPNPAYKSITIELIAAKMENAQIIVTDMNGSKVLQGQASLNSGMNKVAFDVSTLSAGVYNVNVRTAEGTQSIKINKL